MAYYDRLVRDPEAALGEIAERRNLSRAELLDRLSAVRAAAQSGNHLTLGQAQSFFDEIHPPPPALAAHVDSCAYCQAMLDGLHPRRLEQGAERLRKEFAAVLDSPLAASLALAVPPPVAAVVKWSRMKWLQPAATAAFGFVLAIAVVAKPVAAYFSDSRELLELKAENARLRGTVASLDDGQWPALASLDGSRLSTFSSGNHALVVALDSFAQVSCEMRGSGSDRRRVCALPSASNDTFGLLPSIGLQGEWEVVSAMPNTIGGTSLQLTRAGAAGPAPVELTPGDKIVVLNLTKYARPKAPASDSSAPVETPRN